MSGIGGYVSKPIAEKRAADDAAGRLRTILAVDLTEKILVITVKPRAMSMMFSLLIPSMSGRSVNIESLLG
jgi:hypothetical protein